MMARSAREVWFKVERFARESRGKNWCAGQAIVYVGLGVVEQMEKTKSQTRQKREASLAGKLVIARQGEGGKARQ